MNETKIESVMNKKLMQSLQHELRTPLGYINSSAGALRRDNNSEKIELV